MDEITYVFTDAKNKVKSVAIYRGVEVEYWHRATADYGTELTEVYIKAEALHALGDTETLETLITPYLSGENTYSIETVEIDGELTTVESGADTRSVMSVWYDDKLGA
jgi:hypothetical protein